MTRDEIIADLREKYPVMKSGNDSVGYIEYTPTEYEDTLNEWADSIEADIKAKEDAVKALAKAEADKAALLTKLGLTTDELKTLLS